MSNQLGVQKLTIQAILQLVWHCGGATHTKRAYGKPTEGENSICFSFQYIDYKLISERLDRVKTRDHPQFFLCNEEL